MGPLARGDLLRRVGEVAAARSCFERAAGLTDNAQVRGAAARQLEALANQP